MNTSTESQAATEIAHLHAENIAATAATLERAIRIGELVFAQKQQLKHGEWLPWLTAHVPFSHTTARNYVRVFQNRVGFKSVTVADLHAAYRLLNERFEVHPLGEIFPWNEAVVKLITASLRDTRRLVEPITLLEGKILDGKLRYEACRRARVEPMFEEFTGKDPIHFLIQKNLLRQHHSPDQQAAIAEAARQLETAASSLQRSDVL